MKASWTRNTNKETYKTKKICTVFIGFAKIKSFLLLYIFNGPHDEATASRLLNKYEYFLLII